LSVKPNPAPRRPVTDEESISIFLRPDSFSTASDMASRAESSSPYERSEEKIHAAPAPCARLLARPLTSFHGHGACSRARLSRALPARTPATPSVVPPDFLPTGDGGRRRDFRSWITDWLAFSWGLPPTGKRITLAAAEDDSTAGVSCAAVNTEQTGKQARAKAQTGIFLMVSPADSIPQPPLQTATITLWP